MDTCTGDSFVLTLSALMAPETIKPNNTQNTTQQNKQTKPAGKFGKEGRIAQHDLFLKETRTNVANITVTKKH